MCVTDSIVMGKRPPGQRFFEITVLYSVFSNLAVDRRFSTPVAATVDGNLSKVVKKKKCRDMLCNIVKRNA